MFSAPRAVFQNHQHVGQQRVIPAHRCRWWRAPFGQSVGLADRRIKVDGEWCVAGSGTGLPPGPARLTRSSSDMAPPEAAQEGAQGGGSLSRETEHAGGPAGAQHIMQSPRGGGHQGHPCRRCSPGPARRRGQVLPEELGQAKAQGEGGGKDTAHQAVVVEGDLDASGWLRGRANVELITGGVELITGGVPRPGTDTSVPPASGA